MVKDLYRETEVIRKMYVFNEISNMVDSFFIINKFHVSLCD